MMGFRSCVLIGTLVAHKGNFRVKMKIRRKKAQQTVRIVCNSIRFIYDHSLLENISLESRNL